MNVVKQKDLEGMTRSTRISGERRGGRKEKEARQAAIGGTRRIKKGDEGLRKKGRKSKDFD